MSSNPARSRALSWIAKSLGTTRRPLTSTERCSSISRTSRRPSSIGRIDAREPRNTPSTIRSRRRSNDCKPMVASDATGGLSPAPDAPRGSAAIASGPRPRPVGSVAVLLGRVAEWQTRWLQVPVRETSWGFKSPLAHHEAPAQAGSSVRFGPTSTGSLIEAVRHGHSPPHQGAPSTISPPPDSRAW